MTNYYDELKYKNEILSVAYSLGFRGKKTGSVVQGDCPKHGSSGGRCLNIWSASQRFHCFHCDRSGDVINLVELFKGCDHISAVNFLADKAGMAHLNARDLSPDEQAKVQAEYQERVLVENILTEATRWFYGQLKNYPEITNHLLNKYGFSEEIIEELEIGFAPPDDKPNGELYQHLSSFPEFKDKLHLSGLFTFGSLSGPYYSYFKGRIIFPYWRHGKVVYLAARATKLTPRDQYECYPEKNGEQEHIKYKKLRTHDPNDDKKKYISRFIQNDAFMGEDSIRSATEIIITEGAADWVSAVDKGFAAISPVTVNFRERDLEKLRNLTSHAHSIFIINDNEENEAGLKGALRTAKFLSQAGRNVYLVELPRPEDEKKDKIDLNEYFLNHTDEDLKALMTQTKSFIEVIIASLPEDFIRAEALIKQEVFPMLVNRPNAIREHYLDMLRIRVKAKKSVIEKMLSDFLLELAKSKSEDEQEEIDPEILKSAEELARDPQLFKKRLDVINQSGVVGERKAMSMYFAALDSRLLPLNLVSPNALAIKNAGHFGSGKSFTLGSCLQIYPEAKFKLITNGSAKSIYYLPDGLKHKALIVTEGFQFQEKNAEDSELVYAVRSLISEGQINYCVPEKDANGKFETKEKRIEGPTSFITTTVVDKLEAQLEDRLFTVHPNEGVDQTKRILEMTALIASGQHTGLDEKTIAIWKQFHLLLKPVEVIVPFAPQIARFIIKENVVPLSTRRAIKRVLIVIKAIASIYQYQRKRDKHDRVIAEICDYYMALQIVREAFRENMGVENESNEKRLELIKAHGCLTLKKLAQLEGVSVPAISAWIKRKIKNQELIWCHEDKRPINDERVLNQMKTTGKAYVRLSEESAQTNNIGLPSPCELTKDDAWEENGEQAIKYDLGLGALSPVNTPLNAAFNAPLNSEPSIFIPEIKKELISVKALNPKNGNDEEFLSEGLDDPFGELSYFREENCINCHCYDSFRDYCSDQKKKISETKAKCMLQDGDEVAAMIDLSF